MTIPEEEITYFARTHFRQSERLFGIRATDRFSHMYIIGKTGTGKSTLLETLAHQDLVHGNGFLLVDPHGDLAERVVSAAFELERPLTYLNLASDEHTVTFNPLASWTPRHQALAVSALVDAFRRAWSDSWGARLEYILRNALFTLVEQPGAILTDITRLFSDAEFRHQAVQRVSNPQVREFWQGEYEKYPGRFRHDAIAPIQNKVGALLSHPSLYRLLTTSKGSLDPRAIMDGGHVLIVNLAKGHVGEDASSLLGSLLVSQFAVAGLSRADLPQAERRPFFIYLDEFHSFASETLSTMLSELRKYRVGLILAHQFLSQLSEEVRDAVLGNVGTTVTFRLGANDARLFAREFFPKILAEDLISLPNRSIYLKLMIHGQVSDPFSATTISTEAQEGCK